MRACDFWSLKCGWVLDDVDRSEPELEFQMRLIKYGWRLHRKSGVETRGDEQDCREKRALGEDDDIRVSQQRSGAPQRKLQEIEARGVQAGSLVEQDLWGGY